MMLPAQWCVIRRVAGEDMQKVTHTKLGESHQCQKVFGESRREQQSFTIIIIIIIRGLCYRLNIPSKMKLSVVTGNENQLERNFPPFSLVCEKISGAQRNKIDTYLHSVSPSCVQYICQFKVHYRFFVLRHTKDGPVILSWTLFTGQNCGKIRECVMLTPSREMPFVLRDINKKECRSSTTTTHAPYSSYTSSRIHQKSSGGGGVKVKFRFSLFYIIQNDGH